MAKAIKGKKKSEAELLLNKITKGHGISIPKEELEYAIKYVDGHREDFSEDEIANGLQDGAHMDNVETTDLGNGTKLLVEKDQEFIDVDQETLKKALKNLLTKENDFLGMLYERWIEYNNEYFFGELSHPLITIDKLNNRTLGNYTHGEDAMGITNHIRFNRNFISLNTEERILETLRHEMIHQWQDEVLYYKEGQRSAKDIKIKMVDDEGKTVDVTIRQKKRPKDWHNRDFKDFAKVVGIPAIGDKCYGNKAKMPEPQSYNRKFVCACIASNGYPMTVWSTRAIHAVCQVCEQPYREVKKGGKVIKVEQSHIEKPGEDAVEIEHKGVYTYFQRFESKEMKDEFIENFEQTEEFPMTEMVEGVYQKHHNMKKEGFTHWVAYNTAEVNPDVVRNKEVEVDVPKPVTKVDKPAPKQKKDADKVDKPAKKPTIGNAKKQPAKDAEVKKRNVKPKKEKPAVEAPPAPIEAVEEPPAVEVEKPASEEPKVDNVIPFEPKAEPKERSYKVAEDLLEVYKEKGSMKGVAEFFGVTSPTIIYQAKKLGVDFKKGVILDGVK